MSKKICNKKGVALVTVVLIFLVLVLLLAGVMFAAVSNQKNSLLSKDNTSAYYTAESGLNLTIQKIDDYLESHNSSTIQPNLFAAFLTDLNNFVLSQNATSGTLNGINPAGTYTISATSTAPNTYRIQSMGSVNGVVRKVEGTFSFVVKLEDMAKAVIAKSSITMGNNATIIGPIASMLTGQGAQIDVHGCLIGEVFYPKPTSASVVIDDSGCSTQIVETDIDYNVLFNSFTLPAYYSSNDLKSIVKTGNTFTFPPLDGKLGYYLDSLPSTDMVFNLGNGPTTQLFKLYIGDVDAGNNGNFNVGNISVTGNGNLMTLITIDDEDTSGNPKNEFTWDGNVNVGTTDLIKFQLIVRKGADFGNNINPVFTIPNGYSFVGSIQADYVDLGLGNMDFKGFMATLGKSITFTSTGTITGPMWIYAPNATVNMTSNIVLNGAIIAENVNLSSGATVDYLSYSGAIPFELNLPLFMGGAPVPVGITYKFNNFKEE